MTPLDAVPLGTEAEEGRPVVNADPSAYVTVSAGAHHHLDLLVQNISCPGCIAKIERALNEIDPSVSARLNFSTKRLSVSWTSPDLNASEFTNTLARLGYGVVPFSHQTLIEGVDAQDKALLKALGVAGFAWANVMLLSVSVWAGAVSDMDVVTRDFFHWVSALIALPAVGYAGQPFFKSAWRAVSSGRMNMDVPISLAVLLAVGASVWQASLSGKHAYFDAALMLLFFLLVGRFLDQRSRSRAGVSAQNLLALQATGASVMGPDGAIVFKPAEALVVGDIVRLLPGDRIPADGVVRDGTSDLDISVITGEADPLKAISGTEVFAGTLVLNGMINVKVTASESDTFLSHVARLMANAEQNKSRYVRMADRITGYYAPVVHAAAFLTFVGWMIVGVGWDTALMTAIAVLIITCPCALGLAVPAVQIAAAGDLFKRGALLKSGDALERLGQVDTIVFDKTGTLTEGMPTLINADQISSTDIALGSSLAAASRHPLARALVRASECKAAAESVREHAGLGLSLVTDTGEVRLGSREWCGVPEGAASGQSAASELWLRDQTGHTAVFLFRDRLRADAPETIRWLLSSGFKLLLLSGDRIEAVEAMARQAGIADWHGSQSPEDKIQAVCDLQREGHRVAMIGDGLNDAPALAAADVSLSPSSAAEVSQNAADIIYLNGRLSTLPDLIKTAQVSVGRVKQNFLLALIYNIFALPLAVFGFVTPVIAAAAMSGSSLIVTTNALRPFLKRRRPA